MIRKEELFPIDFLRYRFLVIPEFAALGKNVQDPVYKTSLDAG
jgi:hypothetical protein